MLSAFISFAGTINSGSLNSVGTTVFYLWVRDALRNIPNSYSQLCVVSTALLVW